MALKTKVIGVLRFSVLTPTYYSERFDTLEKTAAHLFSPERMALRFRLFENLCLPSLVRQSDPDFDLVVLTADAMPGEYLDRLRGLLDPLPSIHCMPVESALHYQLLKRGYNSVAVDDCTHRILFRLDDDDAVDVNFIKRTKRLSRRLSRAQGQKTPFVISYNRGFYVDIKDGDNDVFDACEHAPLSTGTVLVAPVDHAPNPYRYNHRRLAQYYNTFSDISVPAFIRTIHGDNKSNPTQMGLTRKMAADQIEEKLTDHFGVTTAALQAL